MQHGGRQFQCQSQRLNVYQGAAAALTLSNESPIAPGRIGACGEGRALPHSGGPLRLTCWVCGTQPSSLERERARAHQTGEPKWTGREQAWKVARDLDRVDGDGARRRDGAVVGCLVVAAVALRELRACMAFGGVTSRYRYRYLQSVSKTASCKSSSN